MYLSLPKMKESEAGIKCDNDDDSDNSPDELIKITEEPKEKWDCESILSKYFDWRSISGVIKKVLIFYKVMTCSKITNYVRKFYFVRKSLQIAKG